MSATTCRHRVAELSASETEEYRIPRSIPYPGEIHCCVVCDIQCGSVIRVMIKITCNTITRCVDMRGGTKGYEASSMRLGACCWQRAPSPLVSKRRGDIRSRPHRPHSRSRLLRRTSRDGAVIVTPLATDVGAVGATLIRSPAFAVVGASAE